MYHTVKACLQGDTIPSSLKQWLPWSGKKHDGCTHTLRASMILLSLSLQIAWTRAFSRVHFAWESHGKTANVTPTVATADEGAPIRNGKASGVVLYRIDLLHAMATGRASFEVELRLMVGRSYKVYRQWRKRTTLELGICHSRRAIEWTSWALKWRFLTLMSLMNCVYAWTEICLPHSDPCIMLRFGGLLRSLDHGRKEERLSLSWQGSKGLVIFRDMPLLRWLSRWSIKGWEKRSEGENRISAAEQVKKWAETTFGRIWGVFWIPFFYVSKGQLIFNMVLLGTGKS